MAQAGLRSLSAQLLIAVFSIAFSGFYRSTANSSQYDKGYFGMLQVIKDFGLFSQRHLTTCDFNSQWFHGTAAKDRLGGMETVRSDHK